MLKTIFKEGLIVILLIVIIMIMLAILFYDYIPANKVIPKQIQAYDLPQNIQQELDTTINTQSENIIKTYYIDSTDLNAYESAKDYDRGNPNPFAVYTEVQSGGTNEANGSNTTNKNNSSTNTTNNNQNQTFFNNVGKE